MSLNNSKLAFESSTTLMDLISKLSNNLNQVINGELSSELSFNTEVVQGGRGILVDKSVPNKIIITNKIQQYNTFTECGNTSKNIITDLGNGKTPTNTTNGNILFLGEYTNYFKQKNQNPDPTTGIETFSDNVYINIDDLSNNWMKGQVLRFVFDDFIDMSGNTITFMTDKDNKFKQGVFGKIIGVITTSMMFSKKPIIEITCTDASLYTFNIDIIR